jgi:hypothetical protein
MQFNEADRNVLVAASKPISDDSANAVEGGRELIDKALTLANSC